MHTDASEPIPYARPWLTDLEARYVAEAVAEGRLVQGPWVERLEALIASWTGRKAAVATTSGTAALQLALRAMDVGPGVTAVVPAYTWVATYNAPALAGADVRLADVDDETWLVTASSLQAALGSADPQRSVLVPVHMFGYRVAPEVLQPLVDRGAAVLGDGCCAMGGIDRGLRCGAWTPIECLSFHPRKLITTGEGGMVLTDDLELAERCRRLRDHGAHRSATQRHQTTHGGALVPQFPEPGFNLRMTEMQAAMGVAQMERIDALVAARRQVAAWYDERLAERAPAITRPPGADDPGRVLTFYPVKLPGGERRAELADALAARGIAARTPMVELPSQPFVPEQPSDFPATARIVQRTLGLPYFPQMQPSQVDRVVDALVSLEALCR